MKRLKTWIDYILGVRMSRLHYTGNDTTGKLFLFEKKCSAYSNMQRKSVIWEDAAMH